MTLIDMWWKMPLALTQKALLTKTDENWYDQGIFNKNTQTQNLGCPWTSGWIAFNKGESF